MPQALESQGWGYTFIYYFLSSSSFLLPPGSSPGNCPSYIAGYFYDFNTRMNGRLHVPFSKRNVNRVQDITLIFFKASFPDTHMQYSSRKFPIFLQDRYF